MEENKYPYNLEAERALLNAVLSDPDASIDIFESFSENDFYFEPHQIIFSAMKELDRDNVSVDIVTLTDILEKKDFIKKVGGLTYIEGLCTDLPSTANYKNYMAIVERDSILRRLIKASADITSEAVKSDNAEETLAFAEAAVYNISESKDKSRLEHAAEATQAVLNKINLAISDKDAFRGTPSHFENLDRMLNGLHKSDLMLVAARPSLGKTAFSMNIVANIIEKEPEKVIAVFSLEMSKEQLIQRLISTVSKTSLKDAQRGELSIEGLKRVYEANKIISKSKLFIDDSSMISPPQILSKCRRLVKREGRLDLLVIDYLQLMIGGDGKESRQEIVSEFSRRMKIIAKELDVPLILISQLSRAVERREDRTPQLSDLRESGSIEQDADIVMLLHRFESKDIEDENIRQLIIAKHRNGEVGSLFFRWKGESLSFVPSTDPRMMNITKSPVPARQPQGMGEYIEKEGNNYIEPGNQEAAATTADDGDLEF